MPLCFLRPDTWDGAFHPPLPRCPLRESPLTPPDIPSTPSACLSFPPASTPSLSHFRATACGHQVHLIPSPENPSGNTGTYQSELRIHFSSQQLCNSSQTSMCPSGGASRNPGQGNRNQRHETCIFQMGKLSTIQEKPHTRGLALRKVE